MVRPAWEEIGMGHDVTALLKIKGMSFTDKMLFLHMSKASE